MSAFTRRTAVVALTVASLAVPSLAGAQTPEPTPPASTPETTPAKPGGFSVQWDKLHRANRTIGRDLRRSKAIERVVNAVNDLLVVNREIPIVFTDETRIGPAYVPDQKGQELGLIVFPGWFLKLEDEALRRELRGVKGLGPKRALQYANQFVIAHEMGHALVDQLKLPVTGKEEDAVDGFAAYLLTSDKRFGPRVPLSAAVLFDAIKHDDGKLGDSDFADEHSLPQQRVYQFLCWIYGSDTKRFKGIVGKDMLPRERARRCAGEYRQLRSSWDQLLRPHLKEGPTAS